MKTPVHPPRRGDCRAPTDLSLLGNPLDFMHEDHFREREICAQIDSLANAETPDADSAASILDFLRRELPLHLEDEDEDLFPLLRRRCAPEDEIGRAIARLSGDHGHAERETPRVLSILEKAARGVPLSAHERTALTGYATQARRHLILENAVILPFARLRLTKGDLETLRLRMMQRRGLDRPMEAADAD